MINFVDHKLYPFSSGPNDHPGTVITFIIKPSLCEINRRPRCTLCPCPRLRTWGTAPGTLRTSTRAAPDWRWAGRRPSTWPRRSHRGEQRPPCVLDRAERREGRRCATPWWRASCLRWRGTTTSPSSRTTWRWSEGRLTARTLSTSASTPRCVPGLQSTGSQAGSFQRKMPWWAKPHRGRDCIDFSEDDQGSERGIIAHMEHLYLFTSVTPVPALISTILGSIPTRAEDLVSHYCVLFLFISELFRW